MTSVIINTPLSILHIFNTNVLEAPAFSKCIGLIIVYFVCSITAAGYVIQHLAVTKLKQWDQRRTRIMI